MRPCQLKLRNDSIGTPGLKRPFWVPKRREIPVVGFVDTPKAESGMRFVAQPSPCLDKFSGGRKCRCKLEAEGCEDSPLDEHPSMIVAWDLDVGLPALLSMVAVEILMPSSHQRDWRGGFIR